MQQRKYNGKEWIEAHGYDNYDYHARQYYPAIMRFTTIDPMAEKYYSVSPYTYCANNPVNLIDPDGREVFISGKLTKKALKQLQSRVGNRMTLSLDDNGKLSYTINSEKKLRGDAKKMAQIIDDNSITVNLITTDKNETSTGKLMVGGAFMGNTVTTVDGKTKVTANQEINPNVLGSADSHTKTPGKMMMHETTEAYEGAKISKKNGTGVGPATTTDVVNQSSVFYKAHNKATPQNPVYQTMYDKNGRVTTDVSKATKVEWSVIHNGKSKVIQSYP